MIDDEHMVGTGRYHYTPDGKANGGVNGVGERNGICESNGIH